MKRALIPIVCAAVMLVPQTQVAVAGERALEASARGSVLVATLDVQPAFDPALADARSSSSEVGKTSIASAEWPSFLVDAFFFLYGFQSVERLGLGIAEARWPQGPARATGTQSDLLFANGGDPDSVPGKGGKAIAKADEHGTDANASVAEATLPGGVRIGKGSSTSAVRTVGGTATANATQTLFDVIAGPLAIEAIHATAGSEAGPSGATATEHLVVTGASVAGTPVTITGDDVRAHTADAQKQVNAALASAGIQVRLVPGERETGAEEATASSGGVLVTIAQHAKDPAGTPRDARIGYLLGSATVAVRSTALGGSPPPVGTDDTFVHIPGTSKTVVLPGASTPFTPPAPAKSLKRLIITEVAADPMAGARGAYAAIMLLAATLFLIRPLVRAASRP